MHEKEVTLKGKRLYYRTIGQGHSVVLLHGFGEDSTVWKNQIDAMHEYKLIIPDLPGTGKSEMIDDMSMEGLAEAIKEMIVHETASLFYKEGEPGSIIMIGHSMGGYITLSFVEKYHQMLKGFGLFHSTAYADSEEKIQTRRKGIEFINQHGAFEFLRTTTPNLYAPITKKEKPHLIKEHIDSLYNFSGAAIVSYYMSMIGRPDRTELLKNTHLPVLFIFGKHDTIVPLKDGLEQCFLPNLSYIHILENSAHMGMIEEAKKANEYLLAYLNSIQ